MLAGYIKLKGDQVCMITITEKGLKPDPRVPRKIHAQEVVLMTAIFSHTQQQKPGLEPPSSQEPGNEASFRLVRPWR